MNKSDINITFWGVRGSLPTPDRRFLKYGGNTSCVEVRCNDTILIFDAGSGMLDLGVSFAKEFRDNPVKVNLLISHTHWDHIQGFPYFSFLFMNNKEIDIYGGHCISDIRSLLNTLMTREYFPVTLDEIPAKVNYINLNENPFYINDVKISYTHLLHPALSLGFRVEYKGKVFVYATDNELATGDSLPENFNFKNVSNLIKDADVLVADCQYTEDEYKQKIGWGHSTVERVIEICEKTNIKNLYFFHHDPYHPDKFIDKMIKSGRKLAGKSFKVNAARDGLQVSI